MAKFSVILAAAGKSSRFGATGVKKPFALLNHIPIWLYSARLFSNHPDVKQMIVIVSRDDRAAFFENFLNEIESLNIEVAEGGAERADSIENGLALVSRQSDFVVIHDAARPCIDTGLVKRLFAAIDESGKTVGAAIPAIPVHSTLKRSIDGQLVDETVDRSHLYLAQTPQVFDRGLIESLYAKRGKTQPTDEAQLAEIHGHAVTLVPGSPLNIKITTQQDLVLAEAILNAQNPARRRS